MAGKKGRSGASKQRIFSRVYRISLTTQDSDLLPFFESLHRLPPGQRSAALVAAIRGGAAAGQAEMTGLLESRKVGIAIDALLDEFD